MSKRILIMAMTALAYFQVAGQVYTSANYCEIKLGTTEREYTFKSYLLSARLNQAQNRFEFYVPVSSLRSLENPGDSVALVTLAGGASELVLYASLPGEQVDLQEFKGNVPMELDGQMAIGALLLEDKLHFVGIRSGSNNMQFDFQFAIAKEDTFLASIGTEQVIEIEVRGKGDKMVGITSNP